MVIFTIWVKCLPAWPLRNWLSGFGFLEKRTDTEKQDALPKLSPCATVTSTVPGATYTFPMLAGPPHAPHFPSGGFNLASAISSSPQCTVWGSPWPGAGTVVWGRRAWSVGTPQG